MSTLPTLHPIRLSRRSRPFNSSDWLFEIKFDGFRALAYTEHGECRLVSRNNNNFKNFRHLCASIAENLQVNNAILDGKIICLDKYGRSMFNDLMFRRGEPFFYAFDLLWLNGEDLRPLPLIERKNRLRSIVPKSCSHVLYLDHIETDGVKLFEYACQLDLEGIVAKRTASPYRARERPSSHWIKIKNPKYSQAEGRAELFEQAYVRGA